MKQKGIISYAAYIPFYRLERKEIANFHGIPAMPGERSVAGYDEDAVSMAVEAARACLEGQQVKVSQLYFATTTNPYKEKQSIPTIGLALNVAEEIQGYEMSNSLRAGTTTLIKALLDEQESDSSLVLTADCRIGGPGGLNEQLVGDGATAFLIGDSGNKPIAHVIGAMSVQHESIGQWRSETDPFIQSWEERFQGNVISTSIREALKKFNKKYTVHPEEIKRVVISVPGAKLHVGLGKQLGFKEEQIQDPLLLQVGDCGSAHASMMLVDALDHAMPGDKILVINFAEGVDLLLLEASESILTRRPEQRLREQLQQQSKKIVYRDYLKWKRLLTTEPPRRPETKRPSVPSMYRNYKQNIGFFGSKCTSCGTPHFPKQRICVVCQGKDQMEDYRFIGKKGTVTTYTIDYLAASEAPPAIVGVIDYEDGGRIMCEITDCSPQDVAIGMEVEMTFRRLYEAGGIHNYFWKGKPKRIVIKGEDSNQADKKVVGDGNGK